MNMGQTVVLVAIIGFPIVLLVSCWLLLYFYEKKIWNNGACGNCPDGRWIPVIDADSSRHRGYRCSRCGRMIWISLPVSISKKEE